MRQIRMLLLSVILVLVFCQPGVCAAEITAAGECGAGLSWQLDSDGTLTISGVGAMDDYANAFRIPWFGVSRRISAVVIEEGVSSIADYAFANCTAITSVSVPESVTVVGSRAFSGCTALTSITLPASVTTIGHSAFLDCSRLTHLPFSHCVEALGGWMFAHCTALTEVVIPEGVTTIAEGMFVRCENLSRVDLPDSVTVIEKSAFSGCTGLTDVTIPANVETLEPYCFSECTGLIQVCFEGGRTVIEDNAFSPDNMVTVVNLGANVCDVSSDLFAPFGSLSSILVEPGNQMYRSVDGVLYSADQTVLIRYPRAGASVCSIPEGVTTIGPGAFRDCRGLTTVWMPDTVTAIGPDAFSGCTALTEVSLSGRLADIEARAFEGCAALTKIHIPESVISIDSSAFSGCTALKEIYEAHRTPLQIDTYATADIEIPNLYMTYFTFTPEVTEYYAFTSQGNEDLRGCLYDSGLNLLAEDDDSGENANFSVGYRLEAGVTYLLGAEMFSETEMGEFQVSVGLAHEYVLGSSTEADCTTDGTAHFQCLHCASRREERIPGGHCYERGTCVRCGREEVYPLTVTPAEGGTASDNRGYGTSKTYHAFPVESLLTRDGDGYLRVEHRNGEILVERYDQSFVCQSTRRIPLELPHFGGVWACDDYYFVVCGQTNHDEDDDAEVIRVIRYSRDWVREASASLCGANTTIPFDSGSLRFARSEDMLYIRTSHEKYAAFDGQNHQSNLTLCIRISDMTIVGHTGIRDATAGYVSHSFNQFIAVDGEELVTVDLGDAAPRAVVLFRYSLLAGKNALAGEASRVRALPIAPNYRYHYNYTGVSLGSFEYSDTHYLIAGNSCPQDGSAAQDTAQRNIFIAAVSKEAFTDDACAVTWFTDFSDEDPAVLSAPFLLKLGENRFCLLWSEDEEICYCILDGQGQPVSAVFRGKGRLSDCVPLVTECDIVWYVTDGGAPVFYQIELGHLYSDGVCSRCHRTRSGDVNGDGAVDADDAIYLLYHTLFGEAMYPVSQSCDFTGDGGTDSDDAIHLLYHTLFGPDLYPLM